MRKFGTPSFYILCFFILLSFVPLNFTMAQSAPPKNPNSAKGCALCHYRWIDTFFIDGKGTELVDYESDKVVATAPMCYSCHDGSIVDSRVKHVAQSGHKINIQPPASMKIPPIFPLDEKGNMQCSTCHTAHGVPGKSGKSRSIFMRTANDDSQMCRMCHPNLENQKQTANHPMDIPGISGQMDKIQTKDGKKKSVICQTCHSAHGSQFDALLITDPSGSGLCLSCHADKYFISDSGEKKPFHAVNIKPVNARIPAQFLRKGGKLDKNGEIVCRTCHKVHENKSGKNLLVLNNDENSRLCITCHEDKQYLTETKHNLGRTAPEEKNLQGKTVKQSGICSACHLPHLPARELSGTKDMTSRMCLSCHSKGKVAGKVILQGQTHPLKINPFKNNSEKAGMLSNSDQKPSLPLFNKYGIQDPNGGIACNTCHATHGNRLTTGKSNPVPYFLRKRQPWLCESCHKDKILIKHSKHDFTGKEKNMKLLCKTCHLTHNSKGPFLWADKMVQKNVCQGCHRKDGMVKQIAPVKISHPIHISVQSKGIHTTLPLYDKTDKKSETGEIKCYTCHNPHNGKSSRFLRREDAYSSNLCRGCHPSQGFIAGTDHDLVLFAPNTRNMIQQTPMQSGTCGVCHLVHAGNQEFKLWARNFGDGISQYEKACLACHCKNGPAENKIPQISSHPSGKMIKNIGRGNYKKSTYFPIFSSKTGEPAGTGNISCPSCHNVHQWSYKADLADNRKNLEGNALNSFLRPPAATRICTDCHGLDSLYRFKFFHNVKSRNAIDD